MRNNLVVSFCSLLIIAALSGCATTDSTSGHAPALLHPASARDWHDIDSVEFLKDFKLADFSSLIVEAPDTTTTKLPDSSDNSYAPSVEVKNNIQTLLVEQLGKKLKGKLAVIAQKTASPAEKTLVLCTTVEDIHPGSQAARYWGGFGAGAAWVQIKGEIVDAQTGTALARFEQRRVGAVGVFGGSYTRLLTQCVESIGEDIARLLNTF
ncbi:MAG TPA: DUF4410 domain-containing protein [Verrucomicrobiae bacterium]|jgi:hypothetical protein